MPANTLPLEWDDSIPNELRPKLPPVPDGHYLAWSCVNEAKPILGYKDGHEVVSHTPATVSFEFLPLPESVIDTPPVEGGT